MSRAEEEEEEDEYEEDVNVRCSAAPLVAAPTAAAIPGSSRSRACFFRLVLSRIVAAG